MYGELTITVQNNSLVFVTNNLVKATLDHWHFDTFRGLYEELWWGNATATFTIGSNGKISSVNFEGMEFERKEAEPVK